MIFYTADAHCDFLFGAMEYGWDIGTQKRDQTITEENLKNGNVVVAIGLSEYDPAKDKSFRDVFTRADELMYERKMQLKDMGAVTRD